MVSKKDRRKNGYVTPGLTVSKKELIEQNLFVNSVYDDWEDYRDSQRDLFRDYKIIKSIGKPRHYSFDPFEKRILMNNKQKKLLARRKARKLRMQ
ncbi:MAG: hypothetical protein ACP5N3_02685 [Candidatus Nanoarchaeia archaeon]